MDISKDLGNLMKEAQKMQQRMQEAQDELVKIVVEGEAGAGMVKVKMNGRHEYLKVYINPSLMNEDADMLEDLIVAASNHAVKKIEAETKKRISQLTAGMNIPTDFLKKKDEDN